MASLDDFLKAADLDDLLKIRRKMGATTPDDISRITQVLSDWREEQAVSNLLFYPALIPSATRWDCIQRALDSNDKPYFILAAVVGLQSVNPDEVPEDIRKRWVGRLLEFVRGNGGVVSSRASVTIWPWLRDDELAQFVGSFPVPDDTATKNIMTFTLSRFGQSTRKEYRDGLRSCGLGFWKRQRFLPKFDEYRRKGEKGGVIFMTMPLLSYIPNYGEVES